MRKRPMLQKIEQGRKVNPKLPRLLTIISVVLMVLQVIVSNRLANMGLQISQTDTEIQSITQENTDLRQKIASASSLLTLEEKAQELGFVIPSQPVYLSKDLPVALDLR
ncbi:hypothetical protein C4579_01875 [Candidatus Microgenomates bacterium]|nr:MAG: hypothetical protein C4579_01875 [Candidatus Microgenomates bacterium]